MLQVIDLRDSASFYSLDSRDLEIPHLFSLKTLLHRNPGMSELLMCAETAREIVAAGTGAFLSSVLSASLHQCPVLLFHSPLLLEEAAILLSGSRPTVFLDPAKGILAETYIGWLSGPSPLCIDEYQLSDVLRDGCNVGFIIVAAISGDTISIGAFSPAGRFMQMIEEADTERRTRKIAEPWVGGALADDIDFGGRKKRRCVGPSGEQALIMSVEHFNENACLVPTREVVRWNICEGNDDSGPAQSEVWERLEAPGQDGCPVVAFSRGSEICSVVPVSCRLFPLLAVYLPIAMHDEAEALAGGILSSYNIISEDLTNSVTFLSIRGQAHRLEFQITPVVNKFLREVHGTQELILAVRCGQTVWIRYYRADQDWSEEIGLTQFVADNYKPHSMFTPNEIAAAAAADAYAVDQPYDYSTTRCRFGIDGHSFGH